MFYRINSYVLDMGKKIFRLILLDRETNKEFAVEHKSRIGKAGFIKFISKIRKYDSERYDGRRLESNDRAVLNYFQKHCPELELKLLLD